MKRIISLIALLVIVFTADAQPRYDYNKVKMEKLNRGVIAIRTGDGKVAVSWRLLRSDADGTVFDIFRNGEKIGTSAKETFFIDDAPQSSSLFYEIKGGTIDGSYTLSANAPAGYLPIKMQKPAGGITPDGRPFTYEANDCSIGDADGDGEMEIFVKWCPSNARDNAHDGFTGNTLYDCYKLDGTRLWRIDLGRNIRSGAHYSQFLVYDFDGDGSAEIIVKTADGTIDGLGNVIGDSAKDYRRGVAEAQKYYAKNKDKVDKETAEMNQRMQRMEQGQMRGPAGPRPPMPDSLRGKRPEQGDRPPFGQMTKDERKMWQQFRRQQNRFARGTGRILDGPEYLTIFSGRTGEALCTIDYVPQRGRSEDWGDDNANRCDRYLACVAYLDGEHPSAVMCRGYYTRAVLAAFDWDGKQLTQHWVFDSDNPGCKDYASQGNHNLRVADVDGDGCDEIVYGSCTIDHNGQGLYSTRMGHGDAMHMMAFLPDSDELQVWDCHENRRDGASLRSAKTGEVYFQTKANFDVGRCMAADIDPNNKGVEMWSLANGNIYNVKGEVVGSTKGLSSNFGIWWDGDKCRELLDRSQVTKYIPGEGGAQVIKRFEGTTFNNGSKNNPCLSGDIVGDWREEVLTRTRDSEELRLYVTDIPTSHRITCLLQDIPYRLSIATENVAYNQPPEVGFYLGE